MTLAEGIDPQRRDGVPSAAPTVIHALRRWEGVDVRELAHARHVFWALLWRNVRMRYRQTLLGPLWFMLVPFMRMVLFSAVLGGVAKLPSEGVPYPLFAYSALLPWTLFQAGATRSTESLVRYQGILSKIYFPRLFLPMAEVCTALVDFLMSFGILVALMLWYDFPLTARLLWLPVFLGLAMAFSLSLGLVLSGLHARFRDVNTMFGYVLKAWFYGTPVVYSASLVEERVPEALRWVYEMNPLNAIVEWCRWSIVGAGRPPDMQLLTLAGVAAVLLFVSARTFKTTEQSVVDLI